VIVGAEDAGNWIGIRRQLRAAALSPFVRQKLGFYISKELSQDLEVLRKLLEAGAVRPFVDRTFPLDEVAEAIRYLRDGRVRGKIVITPELRDHAGVRLQAVVALHLDHRALSAGGWDPEGVTYALDDERGHRNRVEFRKSARRRSLSRALG
jgi:Zinc-binding dehydrogenase